MPKEVPVTPITIRTADQEVYRLLRTWITTGELVPGQKLSIRKLAEMCGVSAMPVRGALRQLQAEGLVEAERRAFQVTRLEAEEIHAVFEIRFRLEALASEWAMSTATEGDIAEIEDILQAMQAGDLQPSEWRELNQDFHRRFYDCCGSSQLLEMLQSIWDRVSPYLAIYASNVETYEEADRQHAVLMDHIRSRDLDGLLISLRSHLEYTRDIVLTALR
ncbi:GntR family transcriptional regulator [Nesterenkonia populi]